MSSAEKAPGLFPPPERSIPQLSDRFAKGEHRAGLDVKVKWTKKAPRTKADCDECIAYQHETEGKFGPRRQIRHRRSVNGLHLDLCHAHALAWKDRDNDDGAI